MVVMPGISMKYTVVVVVQVIPVKRLFAFWGVGVVLAWGRGLPDD